MKWRSLWDSEEACEVKSQDWTRKFLMVLCRSTKLIRCPVRSRLGRGGKYLGRDQFEQRWSGGRWWDSEKACEVKSQDRTRKFLMLLCRSTKLSRCLVGSRLGRGGKYWGGIKSNRDEVEAGVGFRKSLWSEVSGPNPKVFDGLVSVDEAESMSGWISVGAWRLLRFCGKWMLKALMFSRHLLVRYLLGGWKYRWGSYGLCGYNSRPPEWKAGLLRTQS
jgi:hypothetical protein